MLIDSAVSERDHFIFISSLNSPSLFSFENVLQQQIWDNVLGLMPRLPPQLTAECNGGKIIQILKGFVKNKNMIKIISDTFLLPTV